MKKLVCPYCENKINYFNGLIERKKGEHTCSKCGKNSTIYYKKRIRLIAFLFVLSSVGLFTYWLISGSLNYSLGLILVFIPFVVFFFITPFLMNFVPLKIYKEGLDNNITTFVNENEKINNDNVSLKQTKVMPIVNEKNNTVSKDINKEEEEFIDISSL